MGHLPLYVTSQSGELCSLSIPSCVKADRMVRVSVADKSRWRIKLCDPLVTHGPYLSALATVLPNNNALYKSPDYS